MSRHWYVLRLASTTDAADPVIAWALQFTPRVARLEEAVALEVSASLRLFGGAAALQARLVREYVFRYPPMAAQTANPFPINDLALACKFR